MRLRFHRWLTLSPAQRAVALDEALERLPPGFSPATDVGHAPALVPQYLHQASQQLFHLVPGDEALLGMSPRRLERVAAVQRALRRSPLEDPDLPAARPDEAEARAFVPRRLAVPALLVGECFTTWQLSRLGVPHELLAAGGVRPPGVGAALKGLTGLGFRLPSEAEWEYVARAAVDSLDDLAPPVRPAQRFLTDLGAGGELCRDSWHPTWEGAPDDAGPWGEGHEVVRGEGPRTMLITGHAIPALAAWNECVWPTRRPLSASPRPVRIRPVVSLAP